MYDKSSMMYIYVETPLHAGSGRAVGVVDLPIQRERVTNYPLVQSSGIKGRLRAEAPGVDMDKATIDAIFGPKSINSDNDAYAGAASFGDARILLLPVRSLYGVFVWTTSANVLARYARDLTASGIKHELVNAINNLPVMRDEKDNSKAIVSDAGKKLHGAVAVLEEFSYVTEAYSGDDKIDCIIKWLTEKVLPQTTDYDYWRSSLAQRLVILPEEDFRDFVTNSTEVVTRVRIDDSTKTVQNGALWSEESLPSDTVLYSPIYIGKSRQPTGDSGKELTASAIQEKLAELSGKRIRLGGDETVGRGSVALRFFEGGADHE